MSVRLEHVQIAGKMVAGIRLLSPAGRLLRRAPEKHVYTHVRKKRIVEIVSPVPFAPDPQFADHPLPIERATKSHPESLNMDGVPVAHTLIE